MATTDYVDVAEYARRRGLSTRTVYTYLKKGLIPGAEQAQPRCAYRIPVTPLPNAESVRG